MNKQLTILGMALSLGTVNSAFAASSTDLTVTGTITPAACTPTLANGGVVDYGNISAKDLKVTASTPLEPKTLQLAVNCDAPTQFAIHPIDNRRDSGGPFPTLYGLGMINGSEKLGYFELRLSNLNADVASRFVQSSDDGSTWTNVIDNSPISSNRLFALGSLTAPFSPNQITSATMDITVTPSINRADGLTLTDEVKLDGSATLQIKYL